MWSSLSLPGQGGGCPGSTVETHGSPTCLISQVPGLLEGPRRHLYLGCFQGPVLSVSGVQRAQPEGPLAPYPPWMRKGDGGLRVPFLPASQGFSNSHSSHAYPVAIHAPDFQLLLWFRSALAQEHVFRFVEQLCCCPSVLSFESVIYASAFKRNTGIDNEIVLLPKKIRKFISYLSSQIPQFLSGVDQFLVSSNLQKKVYITCPPPHATLNTNEHPLHTISTLL